MSQVGSFILLVVAAVFILAGGGAGVIIGQLFTMGF
ncbi:MAG: hypothetical protein XU15_C0011G0115 [candidate division NC10 bacterium CSP1-5]|nr:MAG: hypothetical protein XU15_C0011G0115 [candidate division NC10 bacterium CSP1-5]